MAMTMTLPSAAGGLLDVRMVDGLMYMSLGQMTQGKFWKIDPSGRTARWVPSGWTS